MKANPRKCQFILSSNTKRETRFVNAPITSNLSEKLFRITLSSELKFEEHINKTCNIVSKKLNALHRIGSNMSLDKRKMLLRAFIESQFNCCPLIWMFHSRTLNNKINRLHGKALRIVGARKNAPGKNAPRKNAPGKSAPRKITPRKKNPRKIAPRKIAPLFP